jgi:hypothetical protein
VLRNSVAVQPTTHEHLAEQHAARLASVLREARPQQSGHKQLHEAFIALSAYRSVMFSGSLRVMAHATK